MINTMYRQIQTSISTCTRTFPFFQTRLFVTNQIQYLKHVDDIVVMENNEISERGSYEDLLRHNGAFAQFMRTHLTELDASDEEGGEKLNETT